MQCTDCLIQIQLNKRTPNWVAIWWLTSSELLKYCPTNEMWFDPLETNAKTVGHTHLGSVWIGLILLKLKTYCWNHCSKIIFKCVNSIVGPIFNEKVAKKWNLWVHEQYTIHCLRQKSQHLWLLFIKQYINSNHVLPKRMKKKKKKTQNTDG